MATNTLIAVIVGVPALSFLMATVIADITRAREPGLGPSSLSAIGRVPEPSSSAGTETTTAAAAPRRSTATIAEDVHEHPLPRPAPESAPRLVTSPPSAPAGPPARFTPAAASTPPAQFAPPAPAAAFAPRPAPAMAAGFATPPAPSRRPRYDRRTLVTVGVGCAVVAGIWIARR